MAKNKVSEWSSTPANNTDVGGIDIAEGCAPSGINNAIREMMAQLKDQQSGTDADSFTVGGNLIVSGTTTLTGDATAPTQIISDNSTKVATTAFVKAITGTLGTMSTQNANAVAITGGTIEATFTGNLTGNVTGNVSGSSGSCAGNSATATLSTDSTNAIGYNQTWKNVTRSMGTTYTNSTGKPIQVCAVIEHRSNSTSTITVNGVSFAGSGSSASGYVWGTNSFIVPNGHTYSISAGGTYVLNSWAELR
jgi:hypothetical protein